MLIDVKFESDLLNQPKQCYNLYVVKDAHQNRFTSDFSAFSKKGSYLQIALISKRFEPQDWDWSQNSLRTKRQSQLLLITGRILMCDFFQNAGL